MRKESTEARRLFGLRPPGEMTGIADRLVERLRQRFGEIALLTELGSAPLGMDVRRMIAGTLSQSMLDAPPGAQTPAVRATEGSMRHIPSSPSGDAHAKHGSELQGYMQAYLTATVP